MLVRETRETGVPFL